MNHPTKVGEWTISQITEALSKPIPKEWVKKLDKRKGGGDYAPWYRVVQMLDKYAPGWNWEIKNLSFTEDRIYLVGRLTIVASDGIFYREATGTELLKREVWDKQKKEIEVKELAYGDPSSNAESMAKRRCAAHFGLGLYLYYQDDKPRSSNGSSRPANSNGFASRRLAPANPTSRSEHPNTAQIRAMMNELGLVTSDVTEITGKFYGGRKVKELNADEVADVIVKLRKKAASLLTASQPY